LFPELIFKHYFTYVVHRFIRKALHPVTGACVISTLSMRIVTAAIVFKPISAPKKMFAKGIVSKVNDCVTLCCA